MLSDGAILLDLMSHVKNVKDIPREYIFTFPVKPCDCNAVELVFQCWPSFGPSSAWNTWVWSLPPSLWSTASPVSWPTKKLHPSILAKVSSCLITSYPWHSPWVLSACYVDLCWPPLFISTSLCWLAQLRMCMSWWHFSTFLFFLLYLSLLSKDVLWPLILSYLSCPFLQRFLTDETDRLNKQKAFANLLSGFYTYFLIEFHPV